MDFVKYTKILTVFLAVLTVTGCASNMVLYKEDVAGLDSTPPNVPNTPSCNSLKNAYLTGKPVYLKEGTRWADRSEKGSRLMCNKFDPVTCKNVSGRITTLSKNDEVKLTRCILDAIKAQPTKQVQIESSIINNQPTEMELETNQRNENLNLERQRDVTLLEITKRLKGASFHGKKAASINLDDNMYSLTKEIIYSVDSNDFIGYVTLGLSDRPHSKTKQKYHYSVLQVTTDRVYLVCDSGCNLPVIGIIRVNKRPSPIEKITYNDTKGVYMFLGTETYHTKRNRLGYSNGEVQALLFHRITMSDLGLDNDFLTTTHSNLSRL